MEKTSDKLALYIAAKHAAERYKDVAERRVKALELELELERQRSAALQFQLDCYRENTGDLA